MISLMALTIGLLSGLLLGIGCAGAIYCNIFAGGIANITKQLEVVEVGIEAINGTINGDEEEL